MRILRYGARKFSANENILGPQFSSVLEIILIYLIFSIHKNILI